MSVSGHITAMTVGGSKVTKAYFNGQLVFDESSGEDSDNIGDTGQTLMFTSPAAFTITKSKTWDGKVEWSTNANYWKEYDGGTALSARYSENMGCYVLFFRGTGNKHFCDSSMAPYFVFDGTGDLSVSGDMYNLLDYQTVANGSTPQMEAYCFYRLFAYMTTLTMADIYLKDSVVPNHGYQEMFSRCTALTNPPTIDSMRAVGEEGMRGMFQYCTALEYMPSDFTNLYSVGKYGLAEMFLYSGLKTAPAFSSSNLMLQDYACSLMYGYCSSLYSPVKTLSLYMAGKYCCDSMYYKCCSSSLTKGMDIDLHCTIGEGAFNCCYYECTGMFNPGSIAQNNSTPDEYAFSYMYSYCTGLASVPTWTGVELTADYMCRGMFNNCRALTNMYSFTSLGNGVTTLNTNAVLDMFSNCPKLDIHTENSGTGFVFTSVNVTNATTEFTYAGKTIKPNDQYYTNSYITNAG